MIKTIYVTVRASKRPTAVRGVRDIMAQWDSKGNFHTGANRPGLITYRKARLAITADQSQDHFQICFKLIPLVLITVLHEPIY